jgi:hypothetical protein
VKTQVIYTTQGLGLLNWEMWLSIAHITINKHVDKGDETCKFWIWDRIFNLCLIAQNMKHRLLTSRDTLWPCKSYLSDSSGSSDSLSDHFLLFLNYSELYWHQMCENWCFYGRMPSVKDRVEGCVARAYDLRIFFVCEWHALHIQVTFDWLWLTHEQFLSVNMLAWPITRHYLGYEALNSWLIWIL